MVSNASSSVPPLQVIAQLACFLFLKKNVTKLVKQRLVWFFFLSLLSSFFLLGKDWAILSFLVLLFSQSYFFFPLNWSFFVIFVFYFLDSELAQWAFSLAFQLFCYSCLQFFFEKPRNGLYLVYWIGLLFLQLWGGFLVYNKIYLMAPQKLAALLSGASIVFLSNNRTQFVMRINFFIYFCLSIFIGIVADPFDSIRICGIPRGIFIFIVLHLWPLLGIVLFRDSLPKNLYPFIPFFSRQSFSC